MNNHRYLQNLLAAWQNSNDDKYIEAFDRIMKDWVVHHPLPEPGDSIYVVLDPSKGVDWRDIGEVEWRTIEAGNRLGETWSQMFYSLQSNEKFTPAARLLMLSSIYDHCTYLRQYHKRGHNWTTMEMNGLAMAALAFPEFKSSQEWSDYSMEVMTKEINRQVYPDGVQTEVCSKTQLVALRRFESVADNFKKAGKEVSDQYIKRIVEMFAYLAYSMRPDGYAPLNGDSELEDVRPILLQAAKKYNRPDWEWIATYGQSGSEPDLAPSIVYPWAGIDIMRSGWNNDSQWSFFDIGPYGTGH